MSWFAAAAKQVYGLFVDDGALSAAICVWLVVAAFVLPHIAPPQIQPIILFAGLALLLVDSIRRGAGTQTR